MKCKVVAKDLAKLAKQIYWLELLLLLSFFTIGRHLGFHTLAILHGVTLFFKAWKYMFHCNVVIFTQYLVATGTEIAEF